MDNNFSQELKKEGLSENTISSYVLTIKQFYLIFDEITATNLLTYKGYLIENYKAKSINLKIQAINRYLDYKKKSNLKLKFVKIQK